MKQAEAQLNDLQQERSDQGTQPQQPKPAQLARSGGGFLAGAAQTALGIGGGILIANAGMELTDYIFGDTPDTEDLFDAFDAGYEESAADVLEEDSLFDDIDLDGLDDLDLDDW